MRIFSYFKISTDIIRKHGIIAFFRAIQFYLIRKFKKKKEPHFVQEYQSYVNNLLKVFPRDTAMSIAAGGNYIETGSIQKDILLFYGLKPDMSIIDYGCGSGRLAHALANALPADYNLNYLGIDVIEELLDYARTKSPKNYKFKIHKKNISIPVIDESIDIICAFELFPLLLHEEIYIYLEDMKRALKTGGKVIFSFLEFDKLMSWPVFDDSVINRKKKISVHLNTFTEKSVLQMWAEKIGFKIIEFTDGTFEGKNLGQSLAVFEKIP